MSRESVILDVAIDHKPRLGTASTNRHLVRRLDLKSKLCRRTMTLAKRFLTNGGVTPNDIEPSRPLSLRAGAEGPKARCGPPHRSVILAACKIGFTGHTH
jgi:hypothetical protein